MSETVLSKPAPYHVTQMRPENEAAVRALFEEVFGKPLSPELWRWKYAQAESAATLTWRGEELIAHYGGTPRQVRYFGEPLLAVQITDVMVKLSGRKAVGKVNPFFLSTSHFLESFIGYDRRFLVAFGFPSLRHLKLAERMGLYAEVGRMTECVWDTAGANLPWYISSKTLALSDPSPRAGASPFDRYRDAIDAAWQHQAEDLREHIVGVKDAAFIERRYLRHPEKRYELRLLRQRFTGRTYGLAVLCHEADHSLLMDLVGPLASLGVLIQGARAAAAEAGRPVLKAWCSNAFAERFRVQGARQEELPIVTPTNIWTPGPTPEQLRDKWWLMPGDTDFL